MCVVYSIVESTCLALADIVVLQSPRMVELVAPHDESLKVLQGKEKQHKDVKSCVGFLQLTISY